MIKSITDKGLRRFWETGETRRLAKPDWADRIAEILVMLDDATKPTDMDMPGYDLHRWTLMKNPPWSVKVSGNWRILFWWDDGAVDVTLHDPHSGGRRT